MRNIITRTLTGLVYILLILGAIFYSPVLFIILGFVLNIIAIWEFQRMTNKLGIIPDKISLYLSSAVLYTLSCLIIWFGLSPKYFGILVLLGLYFPILEIYRKKAKPLENIGISFLALIYITLPLIILNYLNLQTGSQSFSVVVLFLFILIWVNDTFAFLSGLLLGKHKLFERITPKKTWEGFIGGIFFTLAVSFVISVFFEDLTLIQWLGFGLIISLSSVFGDFVESFYKRNFQVKDSSTLLPGHGGILDRIDSLIFSAPIIFLYLSYIV